MTTYTTKIGHAHLKVRDLQRAIEFYQRFLSMNLVEQVGNQYAFLSTGEFHHDIALQQVGAQAPSNPPYSVGLYHIAFEVPDKISFAKAYAALIEAGVAVAPVDHLISWAMYFDDPDGNGLEIYWDTRAIEGGEPLWRGRNVELSAEKILSVLQMENENQ